MRLLRARTSSDPADPSDPAEPDAAGAIAIAGSEPVLVGSGPAATVCIADPTVAALHVRLHADAVEAIAPCTVGGVPLAPGARRLVVPLVTVRLGDVLLYVADDAVAPSVPTRELVLGGTGQAANIWPSVLVVEGPNAGARIVLREERPYSIGRSAEADLAIDAPTISRIHFDVRRAGGEQGVRVRDRGATRGTFLGAHRLASDREALWTPHTMIRAGDCVFALSLPDFNEVPGAPAAGSLEARRASLARLATGGSAANIAEVPQVDSATSGSTTPPSRGAAVRSRRGVEVIAIGLVVLVMVVMAAGLVWVLAS